MKKFNVKIGSLKYLTKILPKNLIKEEFGQDAVAAINNISCEMLLPNDIPLSVSQQSFFHESVHGMLDELGMYELNDNEGFVDALAKQLYVFFTENDIAKIMKILDDENVQK